MSSSNTVLLFAGGGTGGHLFPGIALARAMQRLMPDTDVRFAVGGKELEKRVLEAQDLPAVAIGTPSWKSGLSRYIQMLWGVIRSTIRSIRYIRHHKVKAIVGLGGYASFGPILAARLTRRPVYLLEQNTIPGRTNRICARLASRVFTQFPESDRYFARSSCLGNPVRAEVSQLREADRPANDILLIGGSQGAIALNRLFIEALAEVDLPQGTRVIHISGSENETECAAKYAETDYGDIVELHGFVDDMVSVYKRTRLAVCRSGATTVAELTCIGIPMIMVPFPFAKDDHQFFNAQSIKNGGGGICIRQEDLNPALLAAEINAIINDSDKINTMSAAAKALGQPQADEIIAKTILEEVTA